MRGFVIGLVVLAVASVGVLSIRPGGIRHQLRNVGRRLRICLILVGIYMVVSAGLRVFVANTTTSELATAGVGVVLALVFVFLAQERPLAR